MIRARADRDARAARRRLEAAEAEVAALNARLPEGDRLPALDVERALTGNRRPGPG